MKRIQISDLNRPPLKTQKLARQLVKIAADALVYYGGYDPKGKSREQVQSEIVEALMRFGRGRRNIDLVVDHSSQLIKQSRTFVARDMPEFAAVFYAVWFEHWVNHTILVCGLRKRLGMEDIKQIVRESSFRAKWTWVLDLLGFGKINRRHLNAILQVAEIRNAFVHYKWFSTSSTPETPKSYRKERERLGRVVNNAEKTIRYLRRFETRAFFGQRRQLLSPSRRQAIGKLGQDTQ